jgi:hypothetical protein
VDHAVEPVLGWRTARAAWLAAGKEPPSEYAEKREHYVAEQKEIEAMARGAARSGRRERWPTRPDAVLLGW